MEEIKRKKSHFRLKAKVIKRRTRTTKEGDAETHAIEER
jgi:hypothetical protein